jgi:hypothetical protein
MNEQTDAKAGRQAGKQTGKQAHAVVSDSCTQGRVTMIIVVVEWRSEHCVEIATTTRVWVK